MEAKGVSHFSLVTSGKAVTNSLLRQLLPVYELLKKETNLQLCASHGLLNEAQAFALKEAGVNRYHHNLESSRSFYSKICTTHHFDERVATVRAAKLAGMEVCSGGIIGLGENVAQRIELALEISQLQVDSIPLNFLMPVKGTPLEVNQPLQVTEILKILALFRIINPKTEIRIAGGRQLLLGYENEMLKAGISGLMVGNYLTTNGIDPNTDLKLKHRD
jgi:biotin synthase